MNTFFRNTVLSRRASAVWTKFLIPVLIVGFASCKKDSEVGVEIQPEEDIIGLYTFDDLPLITTTVREDSMRTDETPTAVVGTINGYDPDFGSARHGVFSQFSIPNNLTDINLQDSGTATLDSIVLLLAYKFDFYGDTLQQQTWTVYQMTEKIYKDSVYYSNKPKDYNPIALGSATFLPAPRTSRTVNGVPMAAHVRITLDLNFGQMIFNEADGGGPLADNNSWVDFMNGLYIEPGENGGCLLHMNMIDTLTALRLYYHSATDTTDFDFVVNSSTPYYSYYRHNYTGSTAGIAIGFTGLEYSYIQSNAGLKTKIEFPTLNDWYNNLGFEAAINKAELVIFAPAPLDNDHLPLNTRLFVTSIDSVGKERLIIDMFESAEYYGGTLNTTTNVYKINMARYIQSICTGDQQNNGIYLKEIFGAENGRRSIIGSSTNTGGYKMYLRLTYTRIN